MNTLSYRTISASPKTVDKQWVLVDVENETLGRACSKIAMLLRGKHKTNFTPHMDCGDNVVVINAAKIKLTGKKWKDKKYLHYTEYPGGQRSITAAELLKKKPTQIVKNAVKGMIPRNRLGRAVFKNLFVYEGEDHNQEAQKPKEINLTDLKIKK